jgi:site-specific DNA-methyltransferase (adenine-specific)
VNVIHHAQAISVLQNMKDESVDCVYVDPPFGLGGSRVLASQNNGIVVSEMTYNDSFDDYEEFLRNHVYHLKRILKKHGVLCMHCSEKNAYNIRYLVLDAVMGPDNWLNTIVWSYDFGGRSETIKTKNFPRKHEVILVYAKDKSLSTFNVSDVDRLPYKAPSMQGLRRTPEEAAARIARGKLPTDVWDMSIVGTASKERTHYPTQKPIKLLKRLITAFCAKDGLILDCFAGSGSTGEAAYKLDRKFLLIDENQEAIEVMRARFERLNIPVDIR